MSPPFESITQALRRALILKEVQFSVKPDEFPGEILVIKSNLWNIMKNRVSFYFKTVKFFLLKLTETISQSMLFIHIYEGTDVFQTFTLQSWTTCC